MYERLGKFISNHYKAIIAVWAVALVLAAPFVTMANDVVIYQETDMAPSDLESEIAMDFVENNFKSSSDQGSTIIVLVADDVTSSEVRGAVLAIEGDLLADPRIECGVQVDTLYSSVLIYTEGYLNEISSQAPLAEEAVGDAADLIFGLPIEYRIAVEEAADGSQVIYGIPHSYAETWMELYPLNAGNASATDEQTYQLFTPSLAEGLEQMNLDGNETLLAMSWYDAFVAAWNTTASDEAFDRAETAVDAALPSFLEAIPEERSAVLRALTESITFGSYDDPVEIHTFALSMVEAALTMELDDSTLPLAYLQAFNASMPGTVYISDEQLDGAVSSAIHNVANGTEEGAMLIQVHDALGWNGWDNETARHALAVSYVAQVSGAEPWLVERLMDASTMEDVAALSNEIVMGTPIGEFPIQLPDALISTFVNPTNDTMLIAMTYTGGEENVGIEYVEVIRDIVSDDTGGTGLRTYVTGTDAIVTDIKASASQDMDRIDPVSIILVLVLIGLFFRSFVTSAIPPASIGIALGLAMTGVYVLGEFVLQIHYSVLTLLLTSMLGAGCDYCIFVLSRYREERLKGLPKKEAVIASVTWAGESITTSGITVMIGFGVLSISRFSMVSSLGICLAMGILIALMVALTFLPSLLMLAGDRVFWPSTIQSIKREMSSLQGRSAKFRHKVGRYFANSARISIRYAKPIVLAAVLISIPATYLVVSMNTSYDFIGTMAPSESREGVEVIQEGFGGGTILPLYVAVQFDSPIVENGSFDTASLVELETLCVELLEDGNVMEVSGPTRPLGEPIDYEDLDSYSDATRAQYMALMATSISDDGRSALITVTMVDEPLSATSMDTVQDIRSMAEAFSERRGVADVLVAGGTVSMHDISSVVQEDFNLMEVLVVLGIYIVLLIVMGAVFTPVRAIVTILMSISWTLAVTFLVFQALGGTPILWLMPIVLLVVCLGLGMDYDILLTTRIREEVENGMSTDDAITHAVERTGAVITACGIIMAGAFSTLMLSDSALLQEFGFGLALAILLDATVVRIYLVPSIMHLMGKWNWWAPGRLQKVKIEDVVRTD